MRTMLTIVAVCGLLMNQWPAQDLTAQAEAPVEIIPYDTDPCPADSGPLEVCVDGKCPVPDPAPAVDSAPAQAEGPQRSVVRTRVYATQFSARRPVLTAPVRATVRVVRYGLKGGAKLIAAPFRLARKVHNNSLARRASRGNSLAAARLSNKACRGAY